MVKVAHHILILLITGYWLYGQEINTNNASHGNVQLKDEFENGGIEYANVRPYKMSELQSVEIKLNGAWSDNVASSETQDGCLGFTLSEADVRHYFHAAQRISARQYWEVLSMSRCYAYGELTLANGDRGEWRIDAMRRGILFLSNGRRIYFLGEDATAKSFYPYSPEHLAIKQGRQVVYKIPKIKSITISQVASTWGNISDQTEAKCSNFILDEKNVMDYFQLAKPVSFKYFTSNLRNSNCVSEGTILFMDRKTGTWIIESSKRGIIKLDSGITIYLDGRKANASVFDHD